eukprot:3359178-Pleurochrysis_carterae.AAC.2
MHGRASARGHSQERAREHGDASASAAYERGVWRPRAARVRRRCARIDDAIRRALAFWRPV